jgi:hypothetical protein
MEKNKRPGAVTFLAIVNGIGSGITLVFWLLVWVKELVPSPVDLTILAERANAATTYGFMIADLLYSVPLLFIASSGLWRMRPWGWTAAQMVNILWIFSMTVVWTRDAYTTFSPGGILFLPFTLIALWALCYLWKTRYLFWNFSEDKSIRKN